VNVLVGEGRMSGCVRGRLSECVRGRGKNE
jgi:hypothetical protein